MWTTVEWPAKSQGGRNAIFEDVAGNVETFSSNVQRMFTNGDTIDIDACFATSSGVSHSSIGFGLLVANFDRRTQGPQNSHH
jgi:hypothetical protein